MEEMQKLQNKLQRALKTNRKMRTVYQLNREFKARNEILKKEIMRKNDDINQLKQDYIKVLKINKMLDDENFRLKRLLDEEFCKL